MNFLVRQVRLLQLQSQQSSCVQTIYTWKAGNKNLYKRKPKEKILHYEKARLLSVLKPIRRDPDRGKPMWETCTKAVSPRLADPPLTQYETYLRNELSGHLEQSQFVAAVQANPIQVVERKRCHVYLGRQQMFVKQYSLRVLRASLRDTVYGNLLPLFDGYTCLVFSKNPNVKDMLSIFKKYPQYVVLGGFLEGRLLSRTNLEEYAALPSLDVARAQLVSTLNSASTHLLRTLGTSPSVLVSHLESRAEELKKVTTTLSETGGGKTALEGSEGGL